MTSTEFDQVVNAFDEVIRDWYESKRSPKGKVNTNVMTVAVIVSERILAGAYPLAEQDYLADSQVKGLSGAAIRKILENHGEHRPFTSEGGRTSRGTINHAVELAGLLNSCVAGDTFRRLPAQRRERAIFEVQRRAVERIVADFFARRPMEIDVNFDHSTRSVIGSILTSARRAEDNTAGAVAQHLVAAKLAIRFPDEHIPNHSYTTADVQTGRAGDFRIGDTAIHVTMSPSDQLVSVKCRQNLTDRIRPMILVPDMFHSAARAFAVNADLADKIAVASIEDFVAQNLDELAVFSLAETKKRLVHLLTVYNERVTAVEPDPALLIAIPENLSS